VIRRRRRISEWESDEGVSEKLSKKTCLLTEHGKISSIYQSFVKDLNR